MATYYGIITKDADSDYGILFPDVPGCYSAGSTLEELAVMAREALSGHLSIMREEGMEIAPPSDYAAIQAEAADVEGFCGITLVSVPDKPKRVRVNISVPQVDLELIDNAADKNGLDRSSFLIMSAKRVAQGACEL